MNGPRRPPGAPRAWPPGDGGFGRWWWRAPSKPWRTLLCLLLGLCLAALAAWQQQQDNQALAAQGLDQLRQRVVAQLQARLQAYEYGLRGARGSVLTAGEDGITQAQFRVYMASRDLPREFPGARGFGFIRWVPAGQRAAFEQRAQRELPGFRLRQIGPGAADHAVIQYIEPNGDNNTAQGLDIWSEPHRRLAAQAAAASGQATLTAPITLVQATGLPGHGFLLLLPIYRPGQPLATEAQRWQALIGWAYTPLVIDEVLRNVDLSEPLLSLHLRDVSEPGAAGQAFFGPLLPLPDTLTDPALALQQDLTVFGRHWQVQLQARQAFVHELRLVPPWVVGLVGGLLSLLLAALRHARAVSRVGKRLAQLEHERLVTLVENSSDAIISEDLNGIVTSWNRAAEQIFGYRASEALGRPLATLILPDDRLGETRDILARASAGERLQAYDTLRRTRDGCEVEVSIAASAITDPTGRVIGVGKTLRDISHHRQAQRQLLAFSSALEQQVNARTAELKAAYHDLETLLNAVPSMIGYWDKQLINRFANHAYHRWFGVDPGSLPGRSIQSLLGPALFERNRPYIEGALRGERQTFERAIARPDGKGHRHSLAHYLPDVVDGEVRGFYVLVHDVTELTENRLRLAESEQFLRRVGHLARVGGWSLEVATGVVSWSSETRRLHEVDDDYQPTREQALAFYPPAARAELLQAVEHALATGQGWDLSLPLVTARGQSIWVRTLGELAADEGPGQGLRLVGAVQDITAQRTAEAALRRVEAAEAANAAKTSFLANISHEIRTPMNAVIGLTHLLGQTRQDAEQRDLTQRIEVAGQALMGLINDVLDLTRIEAGAMPVAHQRYAPGTLMAELAALLGSTAQARGLTLQLHCDPAVPAWLWGDPQRLRQIALNLLGNALKFTSQGRVQATLDLTPLPPEADLPEPAQALRLVVQDTGIGIEPQQLQQLFTPFTQADASITRRYGGSGLGLSIVRRLAELMGGRVSVSSSPGQGSRFEVLLPLQPADGPPPDEDRLGLPTDASPPADALLGVQVLVVDDHEMNLEVLRRLLARHGAEVQACLRAEDALAQLRAAPERFHVVLMDVQMPDLDGYEATRRLRQLPGCADLPVIALTAGALLTERTQALAAGMNDFLTKPLDPGLLLRTVGRFVGWRGHTPQDGPAEVADKADEAATVVIPAGWPVLPAIDTPDLLARLGPDPVLFAQLLGSLLAEFQDLAGLVEPSTAGLNWPTLPARLHKLRGGAGTLGARPLADSVARAEPLCRQWLADSAATWPPALVQALQAVAAELASLRAQAEPWLRSQASAPAGSAPGQALSALQRRHMLRCLEEQDLAALQALREQAAAWQQLLGEAGFERFAQAVQRLDFSAARHCLEAAGAVTEGAVEAGTARVIEPLAGPVTEPVTEPALPAQTL